jgi:hypothetical protein
LPTCSWSDSWRRFCWRRDRTLSTGGRAGSLVAAWFGWKPSYGTLEWFSCPSGFLMSARITVVIGSCVLLLALDLFARCLSPSINLHGAISIALAYSALLLGIAASVVIGTALAWDIPWT